MSRVYAFMRNPCIYESGDVVVSLHETKAGAWRAMRRYVWDEAVEDNENALRFGGGRADPISWKLAFVSAIEVLP